MKKILLAALLLASVSSVAFAGKVPVSPLPVTGNLVQVPAAVTASFNSRFPTATNVTWKLVTGTATVVYVADFYQGSDPARIKHLQAAFAADGTFLGKQPA